MLEEVLLVRDEQADLAWGLERTARTATGEPRRGSELAAVSLAHRSRPVPPPARTDPRAAVAYEAMNSVPENWIPFIAVHAGGARGRSARLQRAALPHPSTAGRWSPVRSRCGRARTVAPDRRRAHYANEEEVPQAGSRLTVAHTPPVAGTFRRSSGSARAAAQGAGRP
ncbi:hypothetical protein ACFY0G_11215 [Streptomyces sp. NPDC001552]|uniref:hypothetical protein n=1 Tax=Streptomyces sp. NPDC001552 TaxID=3364587 RepID=UPI00368DC956